MWTPAPRAVLVLVALATAVPGCRGDEDGDASPTDERPASISPEAPDPTNPPSEVVVFSVQGDELVAYRGDPPYAGQVVVPGSSTRPDDGYDLDGQVCFDPTDPTRFVVGTRAGPERSGGWITFELSGTVVGELTARETGRLQDTASATPARDPRGCGFLPDGRLLTTELVDGIDGSRTGRLVVWFPPFDGDAVAACSVDDDLASPEDVLVTDEAALVAQPAEGVVRYELASLPAGPDVAGGCVEGSTPGAGDGPQPTRVVHPGDGHGVTAPRGLALGPDAHLYVSSPVDGIVAEFDADGAFVQAVVSPTASQALEPGGPPLPSGAPAGIGVDSRGVLYYTDLGLVAHDDGRVAPGTRAGTLRRVERDGDGAPGRPQVLEAGLAPPRGLEILEVR